jgi:hypothetical protein
MSDVTKHVQKMLKDEFADVIGSKELDEDQRRDIAVRLAKFRERMPQVLKDEGVDFRLCSSMAVIHIRDAGGPWKFDQCGCEM